MKTCDPDGNKRFNTHTHTQLFLQLDKRIVCPFNSHQQSVKLNNNNNKDDYYNSQKRKNKWEFQKWERVCYRHSIQRQSKIIASLQDQSSFWWTAPAGVENLSLIPLTDQSLSNHQSVLFFLNFKSTHLNDSQKTVNRQLYSARNTWNECENRIRNNVEKRL